MEGDPEEHQRRSIRLRGWDYRNVGGYFLTLVTYNRQSLFGSVTEGKMELSSYGEIVQKEWLVSAEIRREIELDLFVVMPNHLHGVVWITESDGRQGEPPTSQRLQPLTRPHPPTRPKGAPPKSLGSFVAGFKAAATQRINQQRGTLGVPLWQRNYYERIIRNERELDAIRVYIEANPTRWAEDAENPERL